MEDKNKLEIIEKLDNNLIILEEKKYSLDPHFGFVTKRAQACPKYYFADRFGNRLSKNYYSIEELDELHYLVTDFDFMYSLGLDEYISQYNNEISELDKINYLNNNYKAIMENDVLKIYIPEVIPKYKNINNFAYKNIMINVMEKTKKYKDYFNKQLVFVFIKVVENQKNIDIDNKFVKPIIDGLVLSQVIADDNIANMFYGVFGITEKIKNPYTEVYVFKGEKMLKWIQKHIQTDT